MRRMIVLVAAAVVLLLGAGITGMALAHDDDGPGMGTPPDVDVRRRRVDR